MTENENGTNPSETPTATNSTSVGNEPAAPVDPMVALQEQITALKQERDKLKDQLLRALAEQDNVRKRVQGSADERVRKAREDVIKELLPVFDNLERATQYMGTAVDVSAVAKGVEILQ